MRRILLSGDQYHWFKEVVYQRKLRQYQRTLEQNNKERNAA